MEYNSFSRQSIKRLSEIADIKGGKRIPKGEQLIKAKNEHPYIKVKDMHRNKIIQLDEDFEFVPDRAYEFISSYTVKEGDIILSIVGTIGLTSIVGDSLDGANLTENCIKISNLKDYDKDFLYYYLTSLQGQNEISKGIVGSTQPKLPIYNIKKIEVINLPLNEQKRIAYLLSSFDVKIENNNAIVSSLEAQAQAIFKSWFIDFEPFQEGSFVDSELGKIPDGWEVKTLETLTTYNKRGFSPKYSNSDEGIPVINQRCIRDNYIVEEAVRYHNHIEDYPEDKIFKAYDVLINSMGVGTLGRVAQSSEKDEIRLVHSCITILRANKNVILPAIFGMLMMMNQSLFESMGEGTTGQTSLKNKVIAKLKFVIPPLCIQEAIEPIFNTILKYKDVLYKQNKILAQLRDTLLPKLMLGELRLGQEEIETNS